MARTKADFFGHARLLASLFVFRPLLGKEQPRIDQGMFPLLETYPMQTATWQ